MVWLGHGVLVQSLVHCRAGACLAAWGTTSALCCCEVYLALYRPTIRFDPVCAILHHALVTAVRVWLTDPDAL